MSENELSKTEAANVKPLTLRFVVAVVVSPLPRDCLDGWRLGWLPYAWNRRLLE